MVSAIAREKQLKRWHRQWKINLIESENPQWVGSSARAGAPATFVVLNLFQDPWSTWSAALEWMLKQVQHDGNER
jgi:hypothetical protein